MLERRSIYYLNKKDPEAIVYEDANGNIKRLTVSDFASQEEFRQWKSWSDSDFHKEDKNDHIYDDNNLSLEGLPESVAQGPSADVILEYKSRNRAREQYSAETIISIRARLTEKQFRRIWLYYIHGLTEAEIAHLEGVGQRRVSTSITSATKKIVKFLETLEK